MQSTKPDRAGWWQRLDPLGVMAVTRERASLLVLLMLLGADLYYAVRHIRTAAETDEESLHFLDAPLGYPEAFQTLQWLWSIGLIVLIAVFLRRWAFAALLPLFAFLVLTDTFELHERFGRRLAESVGIPPMLGLRSQDIGEMVVFGGAGLVTIPIALVGLWLARREDRGHFLRVFALLFVILFCGVVLDAVHILVIEDPGPGDAFGLFEDGGEMLAASLLVAYLSWVWLRGGRAAEPPASAQPSVVASQPEPGSAAAVPARADDSLVPPGTRE